MEPVYLIVDDSAVTRAVIRRAIQLSGIAAAGAEIVEASNGREALGILRARPVSLVLADLHMPEMSGAELIAAMQSDARLREIPVLIVTAEPSAKQLMDLCEAGAKGFLRKPFAPEAIRAAILNVLEKQHV